MRHDTDEIHMAWAAAFVLVLVVFLLNISMRTTSPASEVVAGGRGRLNCTID